MKLSHLFCHYTKIYLKRKMKTVTKIYIYFTSKEVCPEMLWTCRVNERIAKRMYESGVEGRWDRGRPYRVWKDRVKKSLNNRRLTLQQAGMTVHDKVE